MLRIITFNANGLRSASKKNFWQWFDQQQADILCVQELKGQPSDFDEKTLHDEQFHVYMNTAQKKGYSGVALYSKEKPQSVQIGFGNEEFDAEGRYVRAEFENYVVISCLLYTSDAADEL